MLWIGCSDSRVPANEIIGAKPGEVFVHRNIANMVVHSDMNMLSVLDYAVNVLKVKHVIVCGHYGCGGVKAAMGNDSIGIIDNWIRHIKDVYRLHDQYLDSIINEDDRFNAFVEINAKEQVFDLSKTSIVQSAWRSGQGSRLPSPPPARAWPWSPTRSAASPGPPPTCWRSPRVWRRRARTL